MSTNFFELTFPSLKRKRRVNIKNQASSLFSSSDGQTIFGKDSIVAVNQPKIKICPNCSYSINTIETPNRCPVCEERLV